ILRQREQAICAPAMVPAEALGAAQHHAHLDLTPAVQVEQRVGHELLVGAVALPEVRGQLEAVLVHRCAPTKRPRAAAPSPTTRLTSAFPAAFPSSPASASRCVSSIQVENVV